LEAITAERAEHKLGVLAAMRVYKGAIFWSIVVSMCVVMEGYDQALVGNLVALPAFRLRYGKEANGNYQVPASWQTALLQAPIIGSFFGVLVSGWSANRFGYKRTLITLQCLMTGAIFITFFSNSLGMLFAGQVVSGFPWGGFSIIGPAYASEVAPLALRATLTIYIQMCWCIGQLIASGVLYGVKDMTSIWAYRIPFAVQWAWPAPLIVLLCFAPESPWWYVRNGRLDEAEAVIKRLAGQSTQPPSDVVAYMVRTNEIEIAITSGASYWDCFKGVELRRTLIACLTYMLANLTGLLLSNLGTYFFTVAGLPTNKAYALGIGNTSIQLVAVIGSWFLAERFGRRALVLWGIGHNVIILLVLGILGCVPQSENVAWAQGTLVILLALQWGLTLGPMMYTIIAEASSVRLRAKTIGLSRDAYYLCCVVTFFINSYMLNPTAWNLIAKAGFVYCGTCIGIWILAYYGLPESKGRTYRELDILYHRGVPARKFATTKIDDDANE
ncbi:alpha-glucoside:hydrogen symporter, partial [Naematelia encephala]